ncbi:Nudix family hydrolase [Marinobacter salicampi]|uniref:Nudix family hydrolase n=1 Tax=Marinobacter salicampi TaxID=435907 RepID=UPI00140E46F5|nr:Nudix family hydrolase [Marinobacter salicampi]
MKAEVHVAVAVVRSGDRVLIARRPDHVHQGGLLEFPGGKVEADEDIRQALVRELAEETGLETEAGQWQPVIGIRHDYGDKKVFLDVWQTAAFEGNPEGREGQPIGWRVIDDLRDEDFPAANRSIIRALRLPDYYGITGGFRTVTEGLVQLQDSLARNCVPLVVLRAPWLDRADYRAMVTEARELCREAGSELLVHGPHAPVEAAGVHLTWAQASACEKRPFSPDRWLAVSCHNACQISHAVALGADFVTLGPVTPTASHPGAPAMGWERFTALVEDSPVPVYALGGLRRSDLEKVRACGGQGVAGIGNWWRGANLLC